MPAVDDYIFGNGALHEQFRFATQVLAVLVTSAPRSVDIPCFQKYVNRSGRDIEQLCLSLQEALLVESVPDKRGNWRLACEPNTVTLDDVFQAITSSCDARPIKISSERETSEHLAMDVDLLVMQATMAINQSVSRQLRQFSLDRLRLSATAKPPISKQAIREALYDNEYDFEVNAWLVDSVFEQRKRRR